MIYIGVKVGSGSEGPQKGARGANSNQPPVKVTVSSSAVCKLADHSMYCHVCLSVTFSGFTQYSQQAVYDGTILSDRSRISLLPEGWWQAAIGQWLEEKQQRNVLDIVNLTNSIQHLQEGH